MFTPKVDINLSNAAVEPEKESKKSKKDKKKAAALQEEPAPASDAVSSSGALYHLCPARYTF